MKLQVTEQNKKRMPYYSTDETLVDCKQTNLNKFEGIPLYIQNLDDDIDEDRLKEEFSCFGTVIKVEVTAKSRSKSMRSGVVNLLSPADAARAIASLNGGVIVSNILYVTLANQTKQRRKISRTTSLPMGPSQGYSYPSSDCFNSSRVASWGSTELSPSSSSSSLNMSSGASLIDFKRALCRTVSN